MRCSGIVQVDYLDVIQTHDIEFGDLDQVRQQRHKHINCCCKHQLFRTLQALFSTAL